MANLTNTKRIEALEEEMRATRTEISATNDKLDLLIAMVGNKKAPRGNGSANPKTPKEDKPLKTYEPFSKKTDKYEAVSVASKNGNPDALLQVKFYEIPSAKNRSLLKGFGFRWNKTNSSWDNVNNEDSQKIFTII